MRNQRKSKFWTILSALLAFVITFSASEKIILAQQATVDSASTAQQEVINPAMGIQTTVDSAASQPADPSLNLQGVARSGFLTQVKDQLQAAQSDYVTIKRNMNDTQDKMKNIQTQVLTLQTQLQNIDDQIANTTDLIKNVEWQISDKENRIVALEEDIQIKKMEIENQKQMLFEYVKILYRQDRAVYDGSDESVNVAKLLLSDKPVGEILQEMRYFKILENAGNTIFVRLENLVKAQQNDQTEIENARNMMQMLGRQLDSERKNLEIQKQGKSQLLAETQGQQEIYQQLLDQSKQQEDQTLKDIQSLRDNLSFIQKKINELGDKFNPKDYQAVLGKDTTSVYDYIRNTQAIDGFNPRWPVSPSRGLSAYFHDQAYRVVMGMEHQAIDIPINQGTAIHAPADGVVYKTRDNGFGYSYVILAHSGGFMTLYGHVSQILVQDGQKIIQGQTIGLSGGTPGTKGAGAMTTGAHLHFEVIKGGLHVDPLDYMPLSYLPISTLPQKYLSRITGDQAKVQRAPVELSGPTGLSMDNGFQSSNQGINMLVPIVPATAVPVRRATTPAAVPLPKAIPAFQMSAPAAAPAPAPQAPAGF